MSFDSSPLSPRTTDTSVKSILEWLALAHGQTGPGDAEGLRQQLLVLRAATIPPGQRVKLLDLIFKYAERIVVAAIPALHDARLPIARQLQKTVRINQELLETLIREYFSTLAEVLEQPDANAPKAAQKMLLLLVRCIGWHIRISHLVAAPHAQGIWQKLHAVYRTARRLGLAELPGPRGEPAIQNAYGRILLAAIAQPASFCPTEIEFIADYIDTSVNTIEILETPPLDRNGVFWLDLDQDYPARALFRRQPPGDVLALYFTCDLVARDTRGRLAALVEGATADSLELPPFAETPAGRGVLRRLSQLWGQPAKRRQPRRRQSYRVNLCAGLAQLWHLIRHPEGDSQISEWMVVNEGPEGYALMHMAGMTATLRIGDVVAIRPLGERSEANPEWHVGIVRWALSENPEHIEIGIQQLAAHAIAAEVVRLPATPDGKLEALVLPPTPPFRELPALVTGTGQLSEKEARLIVLIEQGNVGVHELRPVALAEQTSSIDVFTVEPDGKS